MIVAIASGGGHLKELLEIVRRLNINENDIVILTNRVELVPKHFSTGYLKNPHNRIGWLVINVIQSIGYSWKFRKNDVVIISTGAGICVPMFILNWRARRIYIESLASVISWSRSAKILRLFDVDIYREKW